MLSLWRVRCAAMQRRQCKGTPRSTHRCARRMGARVRCVSWHKSWGWTSRKARTLPSRWVEPSKTRSICPLLLLRIWCLHTRCCWGIRRVQGGNGTSVCVCVCLYVCVLLSRLLMLNLAALLSAAAGWRFLLTPYSSRSLLPDFLRTPSPLFVCSPRLLRNGRWRYRKEQSAVRCTRGNRIQRLGRRNQPSSGQVLVLATSVSVSAVIAATMARQVVNSRPKCGE